MPRLIGVLGQDQHVPCASCHTPWSVPYLMRDIGQRRLRQEGFAFIWFDDDAIGVNWCPSCDQPAQVRTAQRLDAVALAMAA
jgi:hypothetical protein